MRKEEIIKFYSSFKQYIFPAVVALSSFFLITFAIYPQTVRLINNQRSADGFISKSKFMETKVIALESFDEEDLSQKVEAALASFPADKDFGNLLGLLQQLVIKSGFSISSIALSSSGGKLGGVESYEIKLEIRGDKTLLAILLNNLEDSPRLVRINSISISSNQAAKIVDISLSVEALYSKLPQNFGSADSPLPQITQKDEELIARIARQGSITIAEPVSSSPRGKSNPFE